MRRTRGEAERARAEAEMARREAGRAAAEARRLRAALDALPLGVVVADQEGEVVVRNRPATAIAAARGSDTITAHVLAEALADAGRGAARDEVIELKGPPPRSLAVHSRRLIEAGDAVGAVAFLEDVTRLRLVEAMRRDFVANVSHELRTPVGAIAALAEALEDEEDAAVAKQLTARISTEADRAAHIIEDLLDLSRIEAEGVPAEGRVAAADVIAAAVDHVASQADDREVRLRVAPVDSDVALRGDQRQLASALRNLLDNAIKYSEPGSAVGVEACANGRWVDLVVTDNGIGIPAADHERIFERFYRVDRARSRQTGGTGLGLSIVRHVAINHGGEVLVSSREGEGSTFTLRLPAAQP